MSTDPESVRARVKHLRGLGDMFADGLASIGITKERVSSLLGRDCDCPKRQEQLNAVGRLLGIGRDSDEPKGRNP